MLNFFDTEFAKIYSTTTATQKANSPSKPTEASTGVRGNTLLAVGVTMVFIALVKYGIDAIVDTQKN